jgi:exonuclease VII large subunit
VLRFSAARNHADHVILTVDDGTAVISCCFWNKDGYYSGVDPAQVALARLVEVAGRVSQYKGEMQLRVFHARKSHILGVCFM